MTSSFVERPVRGEARDNAPDGTRSSGVVGRVVMAREVGLELARYVHHLHGVIGIEAVDGHPRCVARRDADSN